jgi:hypothetical protein
MASNEPVGDKHRICSVRKRRQLKGKLQGEPAWTKRNKKSGQFMAVKQSDKKFKGVRHERAS